jgi:hypothetical protein
MPRNIKPWTPDELSKLEALVGQGQSTKQIATELGRTRESVEGKLYRLGKNVSGQPARSRKVTKRRTSGAAFFLS